MSANRAPIHRHPPRVSYDRVVAGRDVAFLELEGERVRSYTLAYAAKVLGMSDRTLLRQLQLKQFFGADAWAPKVSPNSTAKWLLRADDVDAMARGQPGAAGATPVPDAMTALEHENAVLKARIEMFELEEAVRYKDRVIELEQQLADVRHRNAVLSEELQKALSIATNVVAASSPQPVG